MTTNGARKTVLVVEDQANLRDAVLVEFDFLNWQSIPAENGEEAMAKLKASNVDLIVCDIRMPKCDGPQFLSDIRKSAMKLPPFIFMTGFTDLKTYDAMDLGADIVIGKPLNPDLLDAVVKDLTASMDQKWLARPDNFSGTKISCQLKGKDQESLQFGHGGFFVASEAFGVSNALPINVVIQFEIDCPMVSAQRLNGYGRVTWSRHSDVDGLLNGYGVQYLCLDEPGRSEMIQAIQSSTIYSAIPRGTVGIS